ncbi:hypothetical protein ACA910_016851 [Epithemia clementina (nom. ined.)]
MYVAFSYLVVLLLCSSALALTTQTTAVANQNKIFRYGELVCSSDGASWSRNDQDFSTLQEDRGSAASCKDGLSSYESALGVLRAYKSIHGDLVIPRRYVVPADKRFPRAWHGVLLACTVYNMKWWQHHVKQRPERVGQLNELGFVWERLQSEWNLVLEALITFSSLHGHVLVPHKFVVPRSEEWPKATWGIALGDCVYRIRARHDFLRGASAASRRDQLDGLGFVWDVHEYRYKTFYRALRHYAQLNAAGPFSEGPNKPLRVPSNYRVPGTSAWPRGMWGYPLGARCVAVRQKELYVKEKPFRRQMLDDIGFHWGGNADIGWLRVSHAAAIYSRINNRKLDVPYHFRVPVPPDDFVDKDTWPWPEHLWRLPLGQRLKDVRLKGAYLRGAYAEKRKKQLEALGFVWGPKKRGRRKSIVQEFAKI